MKSELKSRQTFNRGRLKRKHCLSIAVIVISIMTIPFTSHAGQNWNVTIVNNNPNHALYQGYDDKNCWYPKDFGNDFTIPKNSTIVKFTEEKWAVFENCGGGDSYITLNFLVFNEGGFSVAFSVMLVDTYEHAPPNSNPLACTQNGFGEPTAVGWAWAGETPSGVTNPVLTCGKSGDSATTNLQITLPTFARPD